ncbi:MAG: hypothetical protein FWG93_07600 [Oscillospiraceae bacterium]|nr:hypothetical protein [Oscillospiraceae bacterium]
MAEFYIKSEDAAVNKTIRMKRSMIDEITALAGKHDLSFNALVVQMCEFALQNHPDKGKAEPVKKNNA